MRPALLAACLLVGGCAALGYRDAGNDLASFESLAEQPQIRYAPGASSYAMRVADILPEAERHVAAFHHRAFRRPPVVYICDTDACFHRFLSAKLDYTAAVLYENRLLLAPRLFARDTARLRPILLHELSHLHMGQYRGHYTTSIPVWFHEGLASLVAEGGGADLASDDDAWRAARAGRHFRVDEQHLPWRRTRAEAFGLSISVFYRQAMLFLAHMRSRDHARFARLLQRLQDGDDFDAAFAQTYQANPGRLAQAFFACVDAGLASDHPLCGPERAAAAASP